MSNSSLITYTNITKNKTSPRNHTIDTITIHCIVGQWTAKEGCDYFAHTDRECSTNYVVGKDGSIGLSVDEADRSWCSSNAANDHRAVTIEVASDTAHPYAVTDAAYNALIKLVADICKRNGIRKLLWRGDKSLIGQVDKQNMTVHRWFDSKACPGEYLYSRHGEIAEKVNKLLGAGADAPAPATPSTGAPMSASGLKVGDVVNFTGSKHYASANAVTGAACKPGKAKITKIYQPGKNKHPYHLIAVSDGGSTVYGWVDADDIQADAGEVNYRVRITIFDLNIRSGPGTDNSTKGCIKPGVYTIVAESSGKGATKWGKLKSGAGWISLDYCQKV